MFFFSHPILENESPNNRTILTGVSDVLRVFGVFTLRANSLGIIIIAARFGAPELSYARGFHRVAHREVL